MTAVALDAVHEVLDDFLRDFCAQSRVVHEDRTHGLGLKETGGEKEVEVLVEEGLVLVVAQAEVLEELVGQPHEHVHPRVLLVVVRDLE